MKMVLKKPGCGCSGSLDYMEHSRWLLFLRDLDAREEERKLDCEKMQKGEGGAACETMRKAILKEAFDDSRG